MSWSKSVTWLVTAIGLAPNGALRAAQGPLRSRGRCFERDVLHRHALPARPEPARLTEPEPELEHTAETDAAALAAERAWRVQMMAARPQ